jgi:hypothetical protein
MAARFPDFRPLCGRHPGYFTASTCYTRHSPWLGVIEMQRREFIGLLGK